MLEVETGDMTLFARKEDLRIVVEEFWDLLEEDFRFWDRDGHPILLDETLLNSAEEEIRRTGDTEYEIVKSHLVQYAVRHGVRVEDTESKGLVDLYNLIRKKAEKAK